MMQKVVSYNDVDEKIERLSKKLAQDDAQFLKDLAHVGLHINSKDMQGKTLLFFAVESGDVSNVARLIRLGVDVNARDMDGRTALFYAMAFGLTDVAELLIRADVNIDGLDKNSATALHYGVAFDKTEASILLINADCDVNVQDVDGVTPLLLAYQNKNLALIHTLVNHGADTHFIGDDVIEKLSLEELN